MHHAVSSSCAKPPTPSRRRARPLTKVRNAIVATAFIATGVQAQASLSEYNGVYLYVRGNADRTRIDEAIDNATRDLGMVPRSVARKRLRESTQPLPRFQVYFESDHVLLRFGEREFDLVVDGPPVRMRGLSGDSVRASAHIEGHDLVQTLQGDRGTRYLEYLFHQDGSVSLRTRIESKHLPHHVSFTLRYQRSR